MLLFSTGITTKLKKDSTVSTAVIDLCIMNKHKMIAIASSREHGIHPKHMLIS